MTWNNPPDRIIHCPDDTPAALKVQMAAAAAYFESADSHFMKESGGWDREVNVTAKPYKTLLGAGWDVEVELACMYELGESAVQFTDLEFLAHLFGTKNINIGEYDHRGGCESCDYGSRSSVTIFCKGVQV